VARSLDCFGHGLIPGGPDFSFLGLGDYRV